MLCNIKKALKEWYHSQEERWKARHLLKDCSEKSDPIGVKNVE